MATNLRITSNLNESISLAWDDNTSIVQFEIDHSTDGTSFVLLSMSDTTTYIDHTTAGITYFYKVRGIDGTSYTSYSNIVSGSSQLTVPSSLYVTNTSNEQISTAWSYDSTSVVSFKVESSIDNITYSLKDTVDSTTYMDLSTIPGKLYWYRIRAYNGIVYSDYSNITYAFSELIPPTNLSITDSTNETISIHWNYDGTNSVDFNIYRSEDGTSYTFLDISTSLSYTDHTVVPGLVTYYRVNSFNNYTSSSNSNVASDIVGMIPPSNLIISDSTNESITISWNYNGRATIDYEVYRSIDGTNYILLEKVNSLIYTDFSTILGLNYFYKVRGSNPYTYSIYSNIVNGLTGLNTPFNLISSDSTNEIITLNWSYDGTSNVSYKVEISNDGTSFNLISTTSSLLYIDSTAIPGIRYFYRIRCSNGSIYSQYSNIISIQTILKSPTNLIMPYISSTSLLLQWTDNSIKETYFFIERSLDGTNFNLISQLNPNTTSYIDSNVSQNTLYYYRVRCYNSIVYSNYSNIIYGVTRQPWEGLNIKDRTPEVGNWLGHPLFSESYLTNDQQCIIKNDSYYVNMNTSDIYVVECDINFDDTTSSSQKLILVHNASSSSFQSATNLNSYIPDCYWLSIDNISKLVTLYYGSKKIFSKQPQQINGRYRIQTYQNVVTIYKDNLYFIGPVTYMEPHTNGYGGFFTTCKNLLLDRFVVYGKVSVQIIFLGRSHILHEVISVENILLNNITYYLFGVTSNSLMSISSLTSPDLVFNNTKISDKSFYPYSSLMTGNNLIVGGTYNTSTTQYSAFSKFNSSIDCLSSFYISNLNDEVYSLITDNSFIYASSGNKIIKLSYDNLNIISSINITDETSFTYISDLQYDSTSHNIYVTGSYLLNGNDIEKAFICILDTNLNIISYKVLKINNQPNYYLYLDDMYLSGGNLYCIGGISDDQDLSYPGIFLFDTTSINLIDYKIFQSKDPNFKDIYFNDIEIANNKIFIVGSVSYFYNNISLFWKNLILKLDMNFNINYCKYSNAYNNKFDEESDHIILDHNNNKLTIQIHINDPEFIFQKNYFLNIDPSYDFHGEFLTKDNQINFDDFSLIDNTSTIYYDSTSIINQSLFICDSTNFTMTMGSSTFNDTSNLIFEPSSKPLSPINFITSSISSKSIVLSWNYNSTGNEDGIYIERKTSGGNFEYIGSVDINIYRYIDSNLNPGTSYQYRIRAYNIFASSDYNTGIAVTTSGVSSLLIAPSNLIAINIPVNGVQTIQLTWYTNATSEIGYYIERKDGSSGSWNRIKTVENNTSKYLDEGVNVSTTYNYRVQAYDNSSVTSYSNISSVVTESSFNIIKYPLNFYGSNWINDYYFYNPDSLSAHRSLQPLEVLEIFLSFDLFSMSLTCPNNSIFTNISFTGNLYSSQLNKIKYYSNIFMTKNGTIVGSGFDISTQSQYVSNVPGSQFNISGDLTSFGSNNIIYPSDFRSSSVGFFFKLQNEDSVNPVNLYVDGFKFGIGWNIPIIL